MDTLTAAYILLLNPLLCSTLLCLTLYIVPYIHPLLCSSSDTEQVHQWVLFGGLCPSDFSHRRCEPLWGKEDDVSPIFGHTIGRVTPCGTYSHPSVFLSVFPWYFISRIFLSQLLKYLSICLSSFLLLCFQFDSEIIRNRSPLHRDIMIQPSLPNRFPPLNFYRSHYPLCHPIFFPSPLYYLSFLPQRGMSIPLLHFPLLLYSPPLSFLLFSSSFHQQISIFLLFSFSPSLLISFTLHSFSLAPKGLV